MANIKLRNFGIVLADLKEPEWERVLEVRVPSALVWLARINTLHPVQFERPDLKLLIKCMRAHALTIERPRDSKSLENIAAKLAKALQRRPEPPPHQTGIKQEPNDKQTALKAMQQDLKEWQKTATDRNPLLDQYREAVDRLLAEVHPVGTTDSVRIIPP